MIKVLTIAGIIIAVLVILYLVIYLLMFSMAFSLIIKEWLDLRKDMKDEKSKNKIKK